MKTQYDSLTSLEKNHDQTFNSNSCIYNVVNDISTYRAKSSAVNLDNKDNTYLNISVLS